MLYPSPSMCFIIQEEKEAVSASGIVLTGNKKKASHGTIHSLNSTVVCPHCIQQFDRKDLAVGDRVLFSRHVAEQIEITEDGLKGKVVWAVPLDSVLAKIS